MAASVAMSEVATTRRSSSIRVGTAYLLIFLCSSVDWLNHYVLYLLICKLPQSFRHDEDQPTSTNPAISAVTSAAAML